MAEAAKEEELSPEEKLLKVIQGEGEPEDGGQKTEDSAPESGKPEESPATEAKEKAEDSPTTEQPDNPTTESGEPDSSKPKLKLKKKKKGKKSKEPDLDDDADMIQAGPIVSGKKKFSGKLSFKMVKMFLVAVVIIMLGLSGLEIFASIKGSEKMAEGGNLKPETGENIDFFNNPPFDIEMLMQEIEQKNLIWGSGPKPMAAVNTSPTGRGTGPVAPPPQQRGMELKLIGISAVAGSKEKEAVVIDKKDGNKMYFLRADQKVMINGREFEVKYVQDDRVIIRIGGSSIIVQ